MDLFAPRHLLIVLVIVLLVFGTKKLKSIGSDLGSAVRGFKDSMREAEQDTTTEIHNPTTDPKQLAAGAQAPADKKPASAPTDKTTAV